MEHYSQIRQLIDAVRARWRALCALQAVVRGSLVAALAIGAAIVASRWTTGAPALLMVLAGAALAVAAAIVLGIVLFAARGPAREAADAASLTLFPARTILDVKPGNARIKTGSPLTIEARLVGNRAPVIAQLQIADGDRWRASDMASENATFRAAMPSVAAGFKYRVVAGMVTSPTYEVT